MENSALYWFFLNILSLVVLAFYSMGEMACVSLNKIRLHYYISKGSKQALWLNYLISNPSRLFGTTLIGVNVAMMVGSEFSREFYNAIGLSPDLAPITQVIIVIIFAELAPMFAARRYAEHVAMLGAPILYFSAKILTPILWAMGGLSKCINLFLGGKEHHQEIFLNQEDLQKILEEQDEDRSPETDREDFNAITRNLFSLRKKEAIQIMQPIQSLPNLPSNAIVNQVYSFFEKPNVDYIPIYHGSKTNIIGIITPRNLIRAPETRRIRDYTRAPWFITENTEAMQILKEFRRNKEKIAIVINNQGEATGIITLAGLIQEIFGKGPYSHSLNEKISTKNFIIDRTFSAQYTVEEFNEQFDVVLDEDGSLTLEDLMTHTLGHHPEQGESIYIAPFELKAVKTSLLETKNISVTTRIT